LAEVFSDCVGGVVWKPEALLNPILNSYVFRTSREIVCHYDSEFF